MKLVEHFQYGLNSPICLTWELTYACNLACVHCLSSSGRRDPRELTTAEAKGVIDELQRMQVFYVNIGGGEPTVRAGLLGAARLRDRPRRRGQVLHQRHQAGRARGPRSSRRTDYVDVQISLDGATAEVNDAVRGPGSYATAIRALENLAAAGFGQPKISVVMTRQNVDQLDEFKAIADKFGAQLRITRLRPSGRGADVWDELHPTAAQQRQLYDWLVARGRGRAHRRLVLPPLRLRRGAARAQPVRRRAGGLPDRPGRRRLRLPVRHPRGVPGRQRPLAGRVRGVWRELGAVHRAAPAADRRRLPQLRVLRLLPGRVHGGEVLHRAAAGRAGPGVRARVRRAGAGRAGRPTGRSRGPMWTTPGRSRGTRGGPGPGADLDRRGRPARVGRPATPARWPPRRRTPGSARPPPGPDRARRWTPPRRPA